MPQAMSKGGKMAPRYLVVQLLTADHQPRKESVWTDTAVPNRLDSLEQGGMLNLWSLGMDTVQDCQNTPTPAPDSPASYYTACFLLYRRHAKIPWGHLALETVEAQAFLALR